MKFMLSKYKKIQPKAPQKETRLAIGGQRGFTLIEILVVVSIIGLLASVVLVGLGGFRERGRDARRIADLRSLQNGLEIYYAKNNEYPATLDTIVSAGIGVNKIPKDPLGRDYLYSLSANKQSYIVAANLEAVTGDPMFNDSYQGGVTGYSGTVATCAPSAYCVQF